MSQVEVEILNTHPEIGPDQEEQGAEQAEIVDPEIVGPEIVEPESTDEIAQEKKVYWVNPFNYEQALTIFKFHISGYSALELTKTDDIPENLRHRPLKVVQEALDRIFAKLGLSVDAVVEKFKLVEHTRMMIAGWSDKLNRSQRVVDELDIALEKIAKDHILDPENEPGFSNLTEEGFKLYNQILKIREGHINTQIKISIEIRNYDAQLSDLTGAKRAKSPDPVEDGEQDPIKVLRNLPKGKLREILKSASKQLSPAE